MDLECISILHVKLKVRQPLNPGRLEGEFEPTVVLKIMTEWECTDRIRAITRLHATAIEEETDRIRSFALTLTEGIHQLLQGSSALDLEKDLVVVIGDLDVQMLADWCFRFLGCPWGSPVVVRTRHLVGR